HLTAYLDSNLGVLCNRLLDDQSIREPYRSCSLTPSAIARLGLALEEEEDEESITPGAPSPVEDNYLQSTPSSEGQQELESTARETSPQATLSKITQEDFITEERADKETYDLVTYLERSRTIDSIEYQETYEELVNY
ncbi:MAG: hypothetical protein LQ342_008580, partial [Letrouitia transgressa]